MITGISSMLNIKNIHKEGLIMANQTQILNVSDEMKFDDNVQTKNVKEQEENMYSSSSDTTEELCPFRATDTCGDGYSLVPTKSRRLC